MLLDVYLIDKEGEDIQVEPSDVKLTSSTLVIVVSHDDHITYVFKGAKVSVVQKFASARKAAALRLQHAYKTRHVEETEGIDDVFIPIMEYLGGYAGVDADTEETSEPAPPKLKPVAKAPPKNTAPPKADSKPPAKTTITTMKTTTKVDVNAPVLVDLPTNLTKVVKTMMSLEPPEGSSCDYLLAGTKLYILLGDNKKDLRKGNFKLEEITTLPEGVFPAENYYPRILVANQKVLGVELWARR
ncbi:MAG: hypothetical protein KGD59_13035 [Candidatus Heimdallarchaeota archaeon]|nr:hypothetical protein [Candidatus Heimdallarchaeota archaeon]MBY8995471.1 hypothetical protein [Candidatus Heimdallarchaeota archaeon]